MTKPDRGGDRKPGQLSLGFPEKEPALQDLLVTSANEATVSVLREPDGWPFPVICVVGPRRSGLTALAKAWCREFDGTYLTARELSGMKAKQLTALGGACVAVDDADQVRREETLLTLINAATAEGGRVVLTSRHGAGLWRVGSADLQSRLNALPVLEIDEPDETMFKARLEASAARYFMKLEPEVTKYLFPRLELTYEAIETFIERLNEKVTLTGRAPSVPLAREVLEELGWADPDQKSLF